MTASGPIPGAARSAAATALFDPSSNGDDDDRNRTLNPSDNNGDDPGVVYGPGGGHPVNYERSRKVTCSSKFTIANWAR